MSGQLTVSSKLTLDTNDFKRGAAEADQVADRLAQNERRRASQYDELTTARVRASAKADAENAAREQAAADRAAARIAAQQAKEEAAAKRREERAAAEVAKEEKRRAGQEAKEQAAAKRKEERDQQAASKSAARASAAAVKAQRAAEAEVANENRRQATRAGQLSFQVNDIVTQLGSGTSPLTVLVQQGPQITQIYGGIGATLRAIPIPAAIAATALAAVVTVLALGVSTAAENEAQQRRFNVELAATGNIAGTTASELERLVRVEALRAGAGRGETAQALGALTTNPLLGSEEQLGRVLSFSRDYAAVTGKELPAAAAELSQAFDGTFESARKLDQAYGLLTAREYEQIRALDEQGRKQEAVSVLIEATERRFKGLAEQGLSPVEQNLNRLGNAWVNFKDKVANNPVTTSLIWAAGHVVNGAAMAIGGPPSSQQAATANGITQDDLDRARQSLTLAEQQLKALQERRATTSVVTLSAAEARVNELRSNVANVEQQFKAQGTGTAEAQQATQQQQAQASIERQAKGYQDLIAKLGSVNAQASQLKATRDQLEASIRSGILSPEKLGEAKQSIAEIDGKLYGLRTTSEELQRNLDLDKKYASLPQHLQAAERAFDQMYEAARKAGDSHEDATRKAEQARANAATQQSTTTREQIAALGEEARAALVVADAYGLSRAAGLRAAAAGAANVAEAQGSIAPGTAGAVATETLQKNAAATVAAASEKNRAYAEEVVALGRLADAEKNGSVAAREAERSNRVAALAIELRAQAEASGSDAIVAAAEKQIEAYDRLSRQQLEVDRRRAANQLNQQFDPTAAYQQQVNDLQALQATGEVTARAAAEASKAYDLQRLESSRSATDGMVAGFRRYADEAQNAGAQVARATQDAMRSAEDAVVQFAMTGKLNVSDLVNSVLADFARIAIRKGITGPLSDAFGGIVNSAGSWLGGLFGGGGGVGGLGSAHAGGVVGNLVGERRHVPMSAFIGAPRFHGGGMVGLGADEIPIIAKRGEEVLTEDDPRHRLNRSGRADAGRAPFTVKIVNTGEPMEGREGESRQDGQGGMEFDVILERVEDHLADKVGAGRGKLNGALVSRYGLQAPGRPR